MTGAKDCLNLLTAMLRGMAEMQECLHGQKLNLLMMTNPNKG
jgi:hypothetical protein